MTWVVYTEEQGAFDSMSYFSTKEAALEEARKCILGDYGPEEIHVYPEFAELDLRKALDISDIAREKLERHRESKRKWKEKLKRLGLPEDATLEDAIRTQMEHRKGIAEK